MATFFWPKLKEKQLGVLKICQKIQQRASGSVENAAGLALLVIDTLSKSLQGLFKKVIFV